MPSPKTKKHFQSLKGKLAALTRFLSKAAGRSLPFFSMLKNCAKRSDFKWTEEAEKAFQEMKALLKNLDRANFQGNLYLVFSNCAEAVSSILIIERDGVQTPIYFVSKALTGSELNYYPIEKSAVKGHILADYLAETTSDMPIMLDLENITLSVPKFWELYTDGTSGPEGAGAGLLLTGPDKEEHTYALRLNFKATNNEAEYEALLAGIRLAKEIGIKKLQAYVDSQLVANHINGTLDAHDEGMQITNIIEFLKTGSLPEDDEEAKKIRVKAPMYELRDNVLYRKSYLGPSFRCVRPKQAKKIIDEVHAGAFALHSGFRTVAEKIKRLGYYWPSIYNDAAERIRFEGEPFRSWCQGLNIKQSFTSVSHPQANGQYEVSNRDTVHAIKGRLGKQRRGWVDQLPKVLWAHHTTPINSTGETPFSLVYGSEVVLLTEIAIPTEQTLSFSQDKNSRDLRTNLDLLEERREMAATCEAINKQCIARFQYSPKNFLDL
ncbi:uncharacterized protein [Rutidosis leptorrhynchoides]|uniref:uncharacterized protein n=1 Tax=Rutidosis leptorrhynchoides TaxID=125765 RepID=UPI003A994410